MSEQHLSDDELDLLADLLAGEGSEDDVARVQASPRLAQALAELEAADVAVAADLARLDEVVPPAGFEARLQQALADEAEPPSRSAVAGPAPAGQASGGQASAAQASAGTGAGPAQDVVPLAGRREARAQQRQPWLLRGAASVAGLLVLGGLGVAVLQGSGSSDDDTAASAVPEAAASAVAGGQVPTSASGQDYQAAGSLQQALPSLLAGTAAPSVALDSGGGSGGTADRGSAAPQPPSGGVDAGATTGGSGSVGAPRAESFSSSALDRLREPAALQACLTALELDPATVPEALDFARYDGQPALVVVLAVPARPAQVEAYVVGPACGQGTDALLFFGRLDRP